jgi:hypothetical protein
MRLPGVPDVSGEYWPQAIVPADASVELAHEAADERPVDFRMDDGSFLGRALQLRGRWMVQCGISNTTF